MPEYQADVWLGSSSGRQRVYVNSNTWSGAREQIKTIYNVDDNDIQDLYESRDNNSSTDGYDINGVSVLVLVIIGFIVLFWKYLLIIGSVGILIWLVMKSMKE